VWGSGFRPLESVHLFLELGAKEPSLGFAEADAGGAWAIKLGTLGDIDSVSDNAAAITGASALTLMVEGSKGSLASVPVLAAAAAPEVSDPPSIASSLVAGAVVAGEGITIWAAGFKPSEAVTLFAITGLSGVATKRLSIGNTQANDNGAATHLVSGDLTTFLGAGLYTVEAFGDEGSYATAPLAIVAEPK